MSEIKWIKITTDMFDDDKIKLIEKMPDSDTLLIIWIKLICLAGKLNRGGFIFLTEGIAYNEEDLATVLSRPVNVVRLAMATFKRLRMIEVSEEGYFFLVNWERHQNIEALEKIREDTRRRVAKYRETHKQLTLGNVTLMLRNDIRIEEEKNRIDKNEEEKALLKKLLDEKRYDEIIIGGQTLSYIIPLLTGEISCPAIALKFYKEALEKLGIDLKNIGVDS